MGCQGLVQAYIPYPGEAKSPTESSTRAAGRTTDGGKVAWYGVCVVWYGCRCGCGCGCGSSRGVDGGLSSVTTYNAENAEARLHHLASRKDASQQRYCTSVIIATALLQQRHCSLQLAAPGLQIVCSSAMQHAVET